MELTDRLRELDDKGYQPLTGAIGEEAATEIERLGDIVQKQGALILMQEQELIELRGPLAPFHDNPEKPAEKNARMHSALLEAEAGLIFAGADKPVSPGQFEPAPTAALRIVREALTTNAKVKGAAQ